MKQSSFWLFAPGLALITAAAFVAAEGPSSSQRMVDLALVAVGVLLTWGVAIVVRQRYPERPLWILLFVMAVVYSLQPLSSSPNALLYTLARAARPGVEVLLVWIMVSFPTGRLDNWQKRSIVIVSVLAILFLWVPAMMYSPKVPLAGPFVTCGENCPANLFFVADQPQRAKIYFELFRTVAIGIFALTTFFLYRRLQRATPSMRRTLAPVLLASIVRAVSMAAFLLIQVPPVLLPLTIWAIPAGIALGLLRGRLYAARVLQNLVAGIRRRPSPAELRDVMAEALDDPSLQLGFWDPVATEWFDATGHRLTLPKPDNEDCTTRVVRDATDRAVAVLIHDRALLDDTLLLDAVISSMQSVLASHQIEAALIGERAQSIVAVDEERRRIERDLHDGSQQRLLALRLKLSVTKRLLDKDTERAAELLAEMSTDVDEIVAAVRGISHGMVPPVLAEQGLAAALSDLARHAGLPVTEDLHDVGRCDSAIESATYYCCCEALQNAAKHAGDSATARISLHREGDTIVFGVEDNGHGMTLGTPSCTGHGMSNMRQRIVSLGGHLEVTTDPGKGVRISGRLSRVRLPASSLALRVA